MAFWSTSEPKSGGVSVEYVAVPGEVEDAEDVAQLDAVRAARHKSKTKCLWSVYGILCGLAALYADTPLRGRTNTLTDLMC